MDWLSNQHHRTDPPGNVLHLPFPPEEPQSTKTDPTLLPPDAVPEEDMWCAILDAMWFELVSP